MCTMCQKCFNHKKPNSNWIFCIENLLNKTKNQTRKTILVLVHGGLTMKTHTYIHMCTFAINVCVCILQPKIQNVSKTLRIFKYQTKNI